VFTNSKKGSFKGQMDNDRTGVTILTNGCEFNGKLYCRGSTRIGGKIEGEIVSEGLLIIEDEAIIQANITAEEAVILGRVKGKLTAKIRVELCPSCSFDGDIAAPVLVIKEGAHFNGRSQMLTMAAEEKSPNHAKKPQESRQNGPKVGNFENGADIAAMSEVPVNA
jgi:cytoskeletal protein CcmA (bactofilin family)